MEKIGIDSAYQLFVDLSCDDYIKNVHSKLSEKDIVELNKLLDIQDFSTESMRELTEQLIAKRGLKTFVCCTRVAINDEYFFDVCDGYVAKSKDKVLKILQNSGHLVHDGEGEVSEPSKGIIEVTMDEYLKRKEMCSKDLMYQYCIYKNKNELQNYDCIQNLINATIDCRSIDKFDNPNPSDFGWGY